jgi:hypothetical protein
LIFSALQSGTIIIATFGVLSTLVSRGRAPQARLVGVLLIHNLATVLKDSKPGFHIVEL